MTEPQNPTLCTPESQGAPLNHLGARNRVFAATVGEDEHAAMLDAIRQAGYEKPAVGARVVLMAFARSAEVRDAVARWYRVHAVEVR